MRTGRGWMVLAGGAAALTAATIGYGSLLPAAAPPLEAAVQRDAGTATGANAPAAAPVTVMAGYDLLETDPDTTYQDLSLPAGFFGPGCNPFSGRVQLQGVPMDAFGGQTGLLPTDTIVRRLGNVVVPDPPGTASVPIEIVALQLMSVQPIQVTCSGGGSFWDVTAQVDSTTPQTQGNLTLQQSADPSGTAVGGTFNSVLPVRPKLIFKQVGGPQTIDMGQLPDPMVFTATGPWCLTGNPLTEPAGEEVVEAPPLTSNFFLGIRCLTEAGPAPVIRRFKVLTVEQAALARHGVLVAERRPHYKCYDIAGPDVNLVVNIRTQFGDEANVPVNRPRLLCPPAKKTIPGRPTEGTFNVPHLKCYDIIGHDPRAVVRLHGQFGTEVVEVGRARELCLAALKTRVPQPPEGPPPEAPHYKCYDIAGKPVDRTVTLQTQFGTEPGVVVLQPVLLCAPAIVTIPGQPSFGTLNAPHLKCYELLGHDADAVVNVRTRFGDEQNVDVRMAKTLCIPVRKVHLPTCTLNQKVSHEAGVTTVQWQVGTTVPATWEVKIIAAGATATVVSAALPAIDPPIPVGPFSFPFPPLGNVAWFTTISTPTQGVLCFDKDVVWTGDPAGAAGAASGLETVPLPDVAEGLP